MSMLGNLAGRGWVVAQPPLPSDGESVVARRDGEPIKSGFLIDVLEDNVSAFHAKYRTGRYDLEVKVDYDIGQGMVKVSEAPGYDTA